MNIAIYLNHRLGVAQYAFISEHGIPGTAIHCAINALFFFTCWAWPTYLSTSGSGARILHFQNRMFYNLGKHSPCLTVLSLWCATSSPMRASQTPITCFFVQRDLRWVTQATYSCIIFSLSCLLFVFLSSLKVGKECKEFSLLMKRYSGSVHLFIAQSIFKVVNSY